MRIISKILKGEENIKNVIPEDLNSSDIYCMYEVKDPINTADVEVSQFIKSYSRIIVEK